MVFFKIKTGNFFSRSSSRTSIGLGVLKLSKSALSLLTIFLSAKYFGVSLERDSWVLSGTIVLLFIQIFFGPINETFRVKFIHMKETDGESLAIIRTGSLLGSIVAISVAIILLVLIFPQFTGKAIAPGWNDNQVQVLSTFLILVIPSLLINQISLIWTSILNAYSSFFIPDIFASATSLVNVICLLFFSNYIGIYSLILSNYIGLFLLLYFLFQNLKKIDARLVKLEWPSWHSIKPFVIFSLPFYASYLIGNLHLFFERQLCTYLGVGNLSILDYARRFIEMPTSILVGVVTTVMTPLLASHYSKGQHHDFFNETLKFIRLITFLITPILGVIIVCPNFLVDALLLSKEFNQASADKTSILLTFLGFGVFAYILFAICGQALIAKGKPALFAFVGGGSTILSTVINFGFYKEFGILVFALSWTINLSIASIIMFYFLFNRTFKGFFELFKLITVICLTLISLNLFHKGLQTIVNNFTIQMDKIFILGYLGLMVGLGMLLLLIFLILFNFQEVSVIKVGFRRMVSSYIK